MTSHCDIMTSRHHDVVVWHQWARTLTRRARLYVYVWCLIMKWVLGLWGKNTDKEGTAWDGRQHSGVFIYCLYWPVDSCGPGSSEESLPGHNLFSLLCFRNLCFFFPIFCATTGFDSKTLMRPKRSFFPNWNQSVKVKSDMLRKAIKNSLSLRTVSKVQFCQQKRIIARRRPWGWGIRRLVHTFFNTPGNFYLKSRCRPVYQFLTTV